MNDQLMHYVKKHTLFIAMLVVAGFFILAVGEYYLYRQTQHINSIVSEGFMQMKEVQKNRPRSN
ncbi:hypothetical protein KC726_04770 [Candidatus Woesebacteria bacterium]|nr:hypothetical protein [Candidatus Woesebacteria bacterium]